MWTIRFPSWISLQVIYNAGEVWKWPKSDFNWDVAAQTPSFDLSNQRLRSCAFFFIIIFAFKDKVNNPGFWVLWCYLQENTQKSKSMFYHYLRSGQTTGQVNRWGYGKGLTDGAQVELMCAECKTCLLQFLLMHLFFIISTVRKMALFLWACEYWRVKLYRILT